MKNAYYIALLTNHCCWLSMTAKDGTPDGIFGIYYLEIIKSWRLSFFFN